MTHSVKIVSEHCVEFFLEESNMTINLVPISASSILPRTGEIVSLPGSGGEGSGVYKVAKVTHYYAEDEVNEQPCPAKLLKVTVAVRRLTTQPSRTKRRSGRRTPASMDPFAVYANGESALRHELEALDIERLKDIVAEYGMDPSNLAMKWKTRSRLVDLIVDTVRSRAHKGDAFR
jgi:hypothetical protein